MLRDLFSLFPAYAGVIPNMTTRNKVAFTFPRIRGGDPNIVTLFVIPCQLFPAHAGVIPTSRGGKPQRTAFPRTCGGDPCMIGS